MPYDLKPISAPRAAGALLKTLVGLVENPVTRGPLAAKLFKDMGITAFREVPADDPMPSVNPLFTHAPAPAGTKPRSLSPDEVEKSVEKRGKNPGFQFQSSSDVVAAYRAQTTNPEQVAQRVLANTTASESSSPRMAFFIAQDRDDLMSQARASAERYRSGKTLGPLDGVPIAVKDEVDQAGYPTTAGTKFLGRSNAQHDSFVVAQLRRAGALLIGKTNMQEIGLGVVGINPHYGAVRNPYDRSRATGGSSSGPGAVVAAGICPISVGADGGGSIRVPAALCGVFGLKPTFGRMSEHGAAAICWSVAHIGPLASTARDLALAYGIMAGPDSNDLNSQLQPTPTLDGVNNLDLNGIRLGVYRAWFDDAAPEIVATCRRALEALTARGAVIVEIEIPELALLRVVHNVTILGEMTGAHIDEYRQHQKEYGHDIRMNLGLSRALGAHDYVHAQRLRPRLCRHYYKALESVDAIVTPTTGVTAPIIREDALATGENDLPLLERITRFVNAGNLTGLPAVAIPAGYDSNGLPISIQCMGRAWDEALLLRLAAVVEQSVTRQKPQVHYDLLS